jgi:hypothetical protein
MSGFYWAWRDDDSVYVNFADTLANIIKEVVQYYDDECELKIEQSERLNVSLAFGNSTVSHEVDNDCSSVSEFLGMIAQEFHRDDQFSIMEEKS